MRLEWIHLGAVAGEAMTSVDRAEVIKNRGIRGDRYESGQGFWRDGKVSRALTMIEGEAIDALSVALGQPIAAGLTRRNLTTRGVRLTDLVGRFFWVGSVLCRGTGICSPCLHLADLTGLPLLRPLARSGGLRADVLSSGQIEVGDPITLWGSASQEAVR
jgi:MOSC domain-containing protein YiiM